MGGGASKRAKADNVVELPGGSYLEQDESPAAVDFVPAGGLDRPGSSPERGTTAAPMQVGGPCASENAGGELRDPQQPRAVFCTPRLSLESSTLVPVYDSECPAVADELNVSIDLSASVLDSSITESDKHSLDEPAGLRDCIFTHQVPTFQPPLPERDSEPASADRQDVGILRTPSSIRPSQRVGIGWVQTGDVGSTPKQICEFTPAKELEQHVRGVSPIGETTTGAGPTATNSFFESGGFQLDTFELPGFAPSRPQMQPSQKFDAKRNRRENATRDGGAITDSGLGGLWTQHGVQPKRAFLAEGAAVCSRIDVGGKGRDGTSVCGGRQNGASQACMGPLPGQRPLRPVLAPIRVNAPVIA